MIAPLETKACQACAKAKRKCGKDVPECARCRRRGIECKYPPNKPSCFVLLEEQNDSLPLTCKHSPCSTNSVSAYTASSYARPARGSIQSHSVAFPPNALAFSDTSLSSIWFNLPSTWQITPWPQSRCPSILGLELKRLVNQIQQWFARWISSGSNLFIHAQLYRHHLPRCVQDAYTTLSAYLHRTPENEHLVFQTIEARVTQFLADHSVPPADTGDSIWHQPSNIDLSSSDTLAHLARAQTLTAYLLVMLFNGDIRLRHVAEQHIPLLEAWIQQMVESGRTAFSPGGSSVDLVFQCDALWHAWILAESLRRTFLVAGTVLTMYAMLKAGKPLPAVCKGGMVFTIRRGAWEAKSAAEWEGMAAQVNLGLMQVGDGRRWVQWGGISREQVDPFARPFLEAACENSWN